jgi:DMSO reductase anchor subunit
MVHEIGRKHSKTLRVIGIVFLALIPWLLLTLAGANHVLIAIAVLFHVAGALAIRWLFFAEAEHTVGLYYGKR